jgi:hypothetical protein
VVMALADALHGLLRLPGATYSCVVERDTGRVLAEAGNGEGGAGDGEGVVPYSVARWGTAVAAMFEATSGDELDDVMITGRRSYHLLRALGPTASVLVYLRLDRSRSNLAAARRELATVRWGALGARPATGPPAAPRPDPPPTRGSRAAAPLRAVGGTGEPRAARTSADDAPRSAPSPAAPRATRVPAALPSGGTPARGLPTAGSGPARSDPAPGAARSASARPDGARARGGPTPSSDAGTATPRTARSESATRTEPAAPRTDGADAAGSRPVPKPDQPARGAQIPLPRRSPGKRSPLTRAASQGGDSGSRRGGGARESDAPDGFPVPAVLGQSWARDPSTLRRLIAGLRRMS